MTRLILAATAALALMGTAATANTLATANSDIGTVVTSATITIGALG